MARVTPILATQRGQRISTSRTSRENLTSKKSKTYQKRCHGQLGTIYSKKVRVHRQLPRAIARKTTEEMHPSCRHRRRLDAAEIGNQALTVARRSFDADVTHPCRAHQDTDSTSSVRRLRPVSGQRQVAHDAHRARQRCRAGCHDEVENASIRSPSLPFHPIRQPGNGGDQRQSLRGVVEPHVTATAGSTPR